MGPGVKSWSSRWHWEERILNFEPSWFTVCMGSGALSQILVNFPYPITGGPQWMRDVGYCVWILDIVLFVLFSAFLVVRYAWHPEMFVKYAMTFPQSSYFGAIPIALDTIITGISLFYSKHQAARWASFALWWISLVMTLLVSFGLLILQMSKQKHHSMEEVAGLWLMTCVPMVITAAAGAGQLSSLISTSESSAITVLIISFLLWSIGLVQVHLILACYFWRLISYKLPKRDLIISGFLPLAPLGQGAFSAQQMTMFLANYITSRSYAPAQTGVPALPQPTLLAVAQGIHWFGIIIALVLLGEASFWFVQVICSVFMCLPKKFSIGFWASTFPWSAYTNGWEFLSRDIRNDGMRGWAAVNMVACALVWLLCALSTVYYAIWKGSLLFAPGLEDWLEDHEGTGRPGYDHRNDSKRGGRPRTKVNWNGTYECEPPREDEEKGPENQENRTSMQPSDASRRRGRV